MRKPLCPTDNVTTSIASYKTTFYLQNLHDLAILFFLTNITKLAVLFYLQKLTRSRDQFLSYETETTTVRDQDRDRCKIAETKTETTKKLVSRPGLETETGLETYNPASYSN